MKRTPCYRTLVIVLVTLLVTSSAPGFGLAAQPPAPYRSASDSTRVYVLASQGDGPFYVAPPAQFTQMRAAGSTTGTDIVLNYIENVTYDGNTCLPWPAEAKVAMDYAASVWETLITSVVPIRINACWTDMTSPLVLGYSGGWTRHENFSGAPVANTWYMASLANALAGVDLNDQDGEDEDGINGDVDAEMDIVYNSRFNWYFALSGTPPDGYYDLASVALHEIAHGLGFAGTMWVWANNLGTWGYYNDQNVKVPEMYDRYLRNSSGQSLLNTNLFPNPSLALGDQLTSNNVYFDSPHVNAANGGTPAKLYAPALWSGGSSIAHLDEIYDDTENALMTYSLDDEEVVHSPGPVTLALLQDIGWGLTPAATAPDVTIAAHVQGEPYFAPGDPVTIVLTLANRGNAAANGVTVAYALPVLVANPSFVSTLNVAATGGTHYTWSVEPLGIGEQGTITIHGTAASAATEQIAWISTATISDAADITPANNSSTLIFGGRRVYLPIVARG